MSRYRVGVAGAAVIWLGLIGCRGDRIAGPTGRPATVQIAPRRLALSGDGGWGCALVSAQMVCWGSDSTLGFAKATGICSYGLLCAPSPIAADGGHAFTSLAFGDNYGCALEGADQLTYCWGGNGWGQLGRSSQSSQAGADTVFGARFTAIGAGLFTTCGAQTSGRVFCWGKSGTGVDGSGTYYVTRPTLVPADSPAVAVSVGNYTACFLTASGRLYCWGSDAYGAVGSQAAMNTCVHEIPSGQIVEPTTAYSCTSVALAVDSSARFQSVSMGINHGCAASVDDVWLCWGEGYGATPAPVRGSPKVQSVSSGGGVDCAVGEDQRVWCVGWTGFGILGRGKRQDSTSVPTPINSDQSFSEVEVNPDPTPISTTVACAISTANQVWCWGSWPAISDTVLSTPVRLWPPPSNSAQRHKD